jgi:plastocyanin
MRIPRTIALTLVVGVIAAATLMAACSNNDNNGGVLTPPAKELDSGNINANGGIYAHAFHTIGTYNYKCTIHPSMTGQVICVVGAPATVAVTIGPNLSFNPSTVSVDTGGTVTWTNTSSTTPHTVTSP